jgi:hypothetical protein
MRARCRSLSSAAFVLAGLSAGCAGVSSDRQSAIATLITATVQLPASPPVVPSASPAPLGKVSGAICFPSEGIMALTAYFEPTAGGDMVMLEIPAGETGYQVELPEGEYYAYAWGRLPERSLGGSYSQAVACGLDASCTDHSLRAFVVSAESPVVDIDLCDWSGGTGSVPTPPGLAHPIPPATAPITGGLSLNCDGSSQRVRVEEGGAAGRTVAVDAWLAENWVTVWSVSGGDPMIQQIEAEAGPYRFGECRSLIIVPIRYSGSGADLRLEVYAWDGAGMRQVYSHAGTKGDWSKIGDSLMFTEARFLYGEPNCCPCAVQTTVHTWDGDRFTETSTTVEPTYAGAPPEYCRP